MGVDAVALHSLNLHQHEYKQWAEADFVIVCSLGVLVLEVKGGGVSCNANGEWTFTNRFGEVFRKSEGPFDQARTARYALEKLVRESINSPMLDRVCYGWGCIFPDVEFKDLSSVEMHDSMVLDSRIGARIDLKSWLENLYQYWREKVEKRRPLAPEDIAQLVRAMRPSFDLVPPLSVRVRNVLENQLILTGEQYAVLDHVLENNRAVISGGAGTGKSVVAIEACRRLAAAGGQPLLVCRNQLLADMFERELVSHKVVVMHHDALTDAVNCGFPPKFSHLVIDEGQDMLELEIVLGLDDLLPEGLSGGNWIMFMDSNNQGSMYGAIDPDVLDYFRVGAAKFLLTKNVRNTPEICRHLSWFTGVPFSKEDELGYAVRVDDSAYYDGRSELVEIVEKQLEEWLGTEEIDPSDITILSPCLRSDSIVQMLSPDWGRRIRTVSEASVAVSRKGAIRFSRIRDFKGLDSPFVLLVDLEYLEKGDRGVVQLYVGMSRANAVLVMPVPYELRKHFRKLKKQDL